MTQIGNHDDAYLSTPLEEKLAWFQNAPGLSAVEPARQFMAGAAALYTDSDNQVRATMRNLGADWAGEAATNAGTTLQRAADWSQGAGRATPRAARPWRDTGSPSSPCAARFTGTTRGRGGGTTPRAPPRRLSASALPRSWPT